MSGSRFFSISDAVVYPTHGVGKIENVEEKTIADTTMRFYVIKFDDMTLRVPISRSKASGLRPLSSKKDLDSAVYVLQSQPEVMKGMWSKKAKVYEEKINSGELIKIAEVVRDLYRVDDPDRSYSERTIYETALYRLASEFAAIGDTDPDQATVTLLNMLQDVRTAA